MRELFVDTSAWYPLVVRAHPDHARVSEALQAHVQRGARLLTTNLVLAESHALVMRRAGTDAARRFLRLASAPPTVVVHSSAALEEAAVRDWLERYRDQDFSLADAVSFAVMRERGAHEALALDHHFAVAGFVRLPA